MQQDRTRKWWIPDPGDPGEAQEPLPSQLVSSSERLSKLGRRALCIIEKKVGMEM